MIRRELAASLMKASRQHPVVAVAGPRQSGKTTLCRTLFPALPHASLEPLDERALAEADPHRFLGRFPRGAFIDEIQRAPALLPHIRRSVDADPRPGRWILAGSQDLAPMVQGSFSGVSESLTLLPLSWSEITRFERRPGTLERALFSGSYPRIFDRGLGPMRWLRRHLATLVERDARAILRIGDLAAFHRFLELCAGRTSELLRYSSLASDCGISQPTAKAWLSVLEAAFIVYRLPPHSGAPGKRVVRTPRLYFYDTGLVCRLLGIRDPGLLTVHPLRGAIFRTWVVSEFVKQRANRGGEGGLRFYRDRHGSEIDLVVHRGGQDDGRGRDTMLVETRSAATPTASFFERARRVRGQLGGGHVAVVYGGDVGQLRKRWRLTPWRQLPRLLGELDATPR